MFKSVNIRSNGKKFILALSKDYGSVQAIAPVAAKLKEKKCAVKLLLPINCHEVAKLYGMEWSVFDERAFSFAPEAYIANVFDESNPDLVLTGSSLASGVRPETPEQYAIREARKRKIPSVTVLDYWGMYEERFCSQVGTVDHTLLPDLLCALDHRCRDDLLRIGVPPERVVITHNPWLDRVVGYAYKSVPLFEGAYRGGWKILYVSQPLRKVMRHRTTNLQHELLELLVSALPQGERYDHSVLVWKHPAELSKSWQDLSRFNSPNVDVCVTEERSLTLLKHIDLVVSVNSTVAFEALHLGTPCLSLHMGLLLSKPYIDELGLSKTIYTHDELRFLLESTRPDELKQQLAIRSKCLSNKRIFFSDGKAVDRVVAEVLKILE
jgi:hypothetical protein